MMIDLREAATDPMHNPSHPGDLVRHDCLELFGLTVTKGAQMLGVSRKALDNLVNHRAGVSPEMAVRLATAFGGSAQAWINMQARYDYAQIQLREAAIKATVRPVKIVEDMVWPDYPSHASTSGPVSPRLSRWRSRARATVVHRPSA